MLACGTEAKWRVWPYLVVPEPVQNIKRYMKSYFILCAVYCLFYRLRFSNISRNLLTKNRKLVMKNTLNVMSIYQIRQMSCAHKIVNCLRSFLWVTHISPVHFSHLYRAWMMQNCTIQRNTQPRMRWFLRMSGKRSWTRVEYEWQAKREWEGVHKQKRWASDMLGPVLYSILTQDVDEVDELS